MRTIHELAASTDKKVYVILNDAETRQRFIRDAENEGYTFGDGAKVSERTPDQFYAVNKNNTVNFLNGIGRMAFSSGTDTILRVDYKKYADGEEDYIFKK